MDEKPIDHARILKVTKLLKGLDLGKKEIALRILSNIPTVHLKWRQIDRLRCAKKRTKTNRASLLAPMTQRPRYSFGSGSIPPAATHCVGA